MKIAIFADVHHEIEAATSPCSTAPGKRPEMVQAQRPLTRSIAKKK